MLLMTSRLLARRLRQMASSSLVSSSYCNRVSSGTSSNTTMDVAELDWKNGLEQLLASRRSLDMDSPVARHQKCASTFLKAYRQAVSLDERREMLKHVISHHGQPNIRNISLAPVTEEKWLADMMKLLKDSSPAYQQLFRAVGHLENGIKFLVDLRADVLAWLGEAPTAAPAGNDQQQDLTPALKLMNYVLRDLLSIWFSVGLLYVERITWKSPCDILQRVAEYESVHPMRSWTDLKNRVGPRRRCFVFLHPAMPREPLVVLHVALMEKIPEGISEVISVQRKHEHGSEEDTSDINAAIFYSINSTQAGLKGIDLGHFMIKRVVQQLIAELPFITAFSTLSPIPNFRKWLVEELRRRIRGVDNHHLPVDQAEVVLLMDYLSDNHWFVDESVRNKLRPLLLRTCLHYLLQVKHRSYAYDPVANFHLRNGAVLWRLNWGADTSAKGLNQSCSLMVNYRYYPNQTEENSRLYIEEKRIQVHDQVLADFQQPTARSGL